MPNIVSSGNSIVGTSSDDVIVVVESGAPNGPDTISAGAGDDVVIGDHAPVFVDTSAANFSMFNAVNIDALDHWSVQVNQDVTGAPFTTVVGTGAGAFDVFAVTIGAGQTITLDTDYTGFDTELRLYDSFGNQLATDDDSAPTEGALGSTDPHDSFLNYTAVSAGTYYIAVQQFNDATIDAGNPYQLNVSVTGHAVAGVLTDTAAGNNTIATATNINATALWSLQGNTDLADAGVAHTTVMGTGTGNYDVFAVTVGAGKTITLDTDHTTFDTEVRLYDAAGNEITFDDDSALTEGGGGSTSTHDSFLQYTATTGGTYYIRVEQFDTDPIAAGGTYQLNVSVEGHLATTPPDADTIKGEAGDDNLQGVDGNDTLDGGIGNDALYGGSGDDILIGGADNDVLYGGIGNDIFRLDQATGSDDLFGGTGIDILDLSHSQQGWTVDLNAGTANATSGAAATFSDMDIESILGSNFDDILHPLFNGDGGTADGGGGNDLVYATDADNILIGGSGVDTVDYSNTGSGIAVSLAVTAPQNTGGSFTDTLSLFENLTGSNFGDNLTGSAGNNVIKGGDGEDQIEGLGGNDVLDGEGGLFNEVSYIHSGAGVTVDLSKFGVAQNTIGAGIDTLSNFLNLEGSLFNDTLTGDDGSNTIYGDNGNDIIQGGGGSDTLFGGNGKDTASYAGATAAVNVNLLLAGTMQDTGGGGVDVLNEFENLTGSKFNDTLIGDDLANVLSGGNGNDMLTGGLGNDTLDGGAGTDTADYSIAASAITVNLISNSVQNTGGAGSDVLLGIENVIGSNFNDILTGNDLANALTGGTGNDILSGGLGNDMLYGGDGSDIASYASATAGVKVSLAIAGAQSTLSAGTDTLTGIEHLTGSAFDDSLTGDGGNNILTGNAGNDTLVGGLGDDTLNGGAGTDTASYASASAAVTVSLLIAAAQNTGGAGVDTLLSIENVTGTNYADTLTGNAQNNLLSGGSGNDTLDGGSGNDTLDGGNSNDILKGSGGDDTLLGGAGVDSLTGGSGADTLTGGAGVDSFLYTALSESAPGTSDRITDLASGDKLDVSTIDANSVLGGNQAFHLAAAFTHSAGEYTLHFDAGTNTTTAAFDTNGDAVSNMTILFTGDVTALTGTWLL